MITNINRRDFIKLTSLLFVGASVSNRLFAEDIKSNVDINNLWSINGSNFHAIYDNPEQRLAFIGFLKNVFSIFPSEKFDGLIAEASMQETADKFIYTAVQDRLSSIKPIASDVRYSLPALYKQTSTIGKQILQLIGERKQVDGYMEIGTKGGYLAFIDNSIKFGGDKVLLSDLPATYELGDIAERRGIKKIGRFVSLNSYAPISEDAVKSQSLDVICNPIGFHHSPPEKRDAFVRSIRRCLRPGGKLIVRDHDVNHETMNHMVALAHDVFNMGLYHPWSYNCAEIRNFTSLDELRAYLTTFGFEPEQSCIYQDGDPTKNALFSFVAV